MGAGRIIDDHLELANIGTNTHAQIDSHIADPSAHHTKYTDLQAVTACDASNKFLERNVENIMTDLTTLKRDQAEILSLHYSKNVNGLIGKPLTSIIESLSTTLFNMSASSVFPMVHAKGTDLEVDIGKIEFFKAAGSYGGQFSFSVADGSGGPPLPKEVMVARWDYINLKDLPIKDIKNHADAALSGTPKLIELLIGATPYYFKVYPTKT